MWKLWGDTTFQTGSIYQVIFVITIFVTGSLSPFWKLLVVLELFPAKQTSTVPEDDQRCFYVCELLQEAAICSLACSLP